MNQGIYLFRLSISANPKFKMASTSSIYIPLVMEIKDRAKPVFKKHPSKSIQDDLEGAFSSIPYDVLHNEYIRVYIHCDLGELGNVDMLNLYNKHLADSLGNLKLEFKVLQDKGFLQCVHFLLLDEAKWIWYILS